MTAASAQKTKSARPFGAVPQTSAAQSAVDERLHQHALGAYLGLAVGDALGATTEFMTPREISQRLGVHRDLTGGGWLKLKPGRVTDDTEMSLALGRVIIETGSVSPHAVAEAFSEWMRTKPVDIGSTVRRGISHYRCTGQPEVASDEHNAGNGACMRCLPVALRYCLSTRTALVEASRLQAHVTHNNPVADAGTETVLEMIVAALRGSDKQGVLDLAHGLVDRWPQFRFDRRRVENPSGWIVETLQVVFQALTANEGLEEVLIDVVNRGGDADTTGAIAGMVAGALYGAEAIPDRWLVSLDDRIRADCQSQTKALLILAQA